jgi:hypothetical protein
MLRRSATSGYTFGAPLVCPNCRERGGYFGVLKIPGERVAPTCPSCDTQLRPLRVRRAS